jgi:PKD repeat protein
MKHKRWWLVILLLSACGLIERGFEVVGFTPTPTGGSAPLAVQFSWTLVNPKNTALTCKLDVDNNGSFEYTLPACPTAATQGHTYTTAGNFTAKLRVEDASGASLEQTTSISVQANQAPTLSSFSATPASGFAPHSVGFSWAIADPNSDALTCKLDVDNNGSFEYTLTACTSSTTRTHIYTAPGSFTAKLQVEDGKGGTVSKTSSAVTVNLNPGDPFNITLRFVTPVTPSQEMAFNNAAGRWAQVIKGGFAEKTNVAIPSQCGPAFSGPIDDLLIDVKVETIDGEGQTLGEAGPCLVRSDVKLPHYGRMRLDSADLNKLEAQNQLELTILHEMGHVLGIGTLWDFERSLLVGATDGPECGADPVFVGPNAVREWNTLGGIGSVPVENTGGAGTCEGHWRETLLDKELMTGFLDAGANPISKITVGSLEDLGYTVDYSAADAYTRPGAGPQLKQQEYRLEERRLRPVGEQ